MNEEGVEYSAEGIVYNSSADKLNALINEARKKGKRNLIKQVAPYVYVNDGSNGSNLKNSYSYRLYAEMNEKPSVFNNYNNNFKRVITSSAEYDAVDGLKLHPVADSGGYSNFTIPQFKK